jgi:amino acid transporter
MTALMPVNGPMLEFPRRFLDRGVGFAVGWMYWFAYTVMAADQIVQVSNSIRFHYDDGKTHLAWAIGESVDPAVWISMTLVVVVLINTVKVRVSVDWLKKCIYYWLTVIYSTLENLNM